MSGCYFLERSFLKLNYKQFQVKIANLSKNMYILESLLIPTTNFKKKTTKHVFEFPKKKEEYHETTLSNKFKDNSKVKQDLFITT